MAISDKSQVFTKHPDVSLELLARGIEQFLIQREDMVCQMFEAPNGVSIQTKKKDKWKKYVLLDNAMQINLSEMNEFVSVQIGGAKWVAKGAAMGVGMIAAWPIAIPLIALSSIGGFGTMNLPKKIMEFIGQFLMTGGKNIFIPPEGALSPYGQDYGQPSGFSPQSFGQPPYMPQSAPVQAAQINCPACQALIAADAKFCPHCGASTEPKKIVCPACSAELEGESAFCPKCGERLSV
jgi:RNA polymerase subunit RPABC4/transcription elongation factor Spt4